VFSSLKQLTRLEAVNEKFSLLTLVEALGVILKLFLDSCQLILELFSLILFSQRAVAFLAETFGITEFNLEFREEKLRFYLQKNSTRLLFQITSNSRYEFHREFHF
jgi:hypothetical protein